MCPTQSWIDNIEKDETWIDKIENGEKENVGHNEEEENWMKNNTEADEKEKSSSENIDPDTDEPNLSESDCKSEDKADVMNADHDEALNDNSESGSSRWATTLVDGEDGLAPAYREVIRELEEHRQHFKVESSQILTRF